MNNKNKIIIISSFLLLSCIFSLLYNTLCKNFPCFVLKPVFITKPIIPLLGGFFFIFTGKGLLDDSISTILVPLKIAHSYFLLGFLLHLF